ncbi:MAG: phenylalanine--tRNA ligase subunit beta [Bacteroidota bacterium]
MNISYNWLRDYIDLDLSPDEVAHRLTLLGLEVEDVQEVGSALEGVVVGYVKECVDHPNADRLSLCQVDIGDDVVQIACGADNVAAGQYVPVATVGTTLPVTLKDGSHLTIKKAKLRGEASHGMICAVDELGLGSDHSGIMVLDSEYEPGTPFSEVYDVFHDTVFDIAITPNRPDATSHIGVARDLAAYFEKKLQLPQHPSVSDKKLNDAEIAIEAPDRCHRYVGLRIEHVKVQESPQWLKNRLLAIGLRPRNNIVDVTNYVMHEMGQPLHAFDYHQLADHRIEVKTFDEEMTFTTLDDEERKVPAGSLFICDGEKPVALAGIMGGQNSEISEETTDVLLESAYFHPAGIRKTSKALALQTDSSYRFERGIDPTITRNAAERAATLIADIGGGTVVDGLLDIHPMEHKPEKLSLRASQMNRILGTSLGMDEAADILKRLQFEITSQTDGVLHCMVPPFRPDVTREADLIEEVARVFDYNELPAPDYVSFPNPAPLTYHEKFNRKVRRVCRGLGMQELYSNSLLPEEAAQRFADEEQLVHTLNPISQDQAVMRPSLAHGFLSAAVYNFNRTASGVRFFEMGHTFQKTDDDGTYIQGYREHNQLLLGVAGDQESGYWHEEHRPFSAFDLKRKVSALFTQLGLHQVQTALNDRGQLEYRTGETLIGQLQEISPTLQEDYDLERPTYWAEFDLTEIERITAESEDKEYQPISRFPSVEFDIALIVDMSVPAGQLTDTIRDLAGNTLHDISIFDVFEGESIGEGNKSIAYRMHFLDRERTLTLKDVEPIINKITKELDQQFGAQLRS